MTTLVIRACVLVLCIHANWAAEEHPYLNFVRSEAARLRLQERSPANAREWEEMKGSSSRDLVKAWGGLEFERVPLDVQILGEFPRDGYRVQKLIFQTMPGVWMSANAYIPERAEKVPAILMVHGHWPGAKQDPVVQARCIGAVKLGYFVLAVDAFGAGERAVGKSLGEYHGDMTAATLLPVGLPLSGIQVYENRCAVDFLQSRSEVDMTRIGITGASGGGNQSMYAGAMDQRLAAVVPVCSVGNYQAYLGAACCMCEVVPGALRFSEEWQVLGMVAPRGLMVVNATRDARQFSVEEAAVSLQKSKDVFRVQGAESHLRHVIFESGHDYSKPMREAMYGWMELHLKGTGNGEPVPEPEVKTEDPESLRCFPGDTRSEDWMTIPKFAAREGRKVLEKLRKQGLSRHGRINRLREVLGIPAVKNAQYKKSGAASQRADQVLEIEAEGIRLQARLSGNSTGQLWVVLEFDQGGQVGIQVLKEVVATNGKVLHLNPSAREGGWSGDKIGRAPDHTTAEWGLWLGRPLLGQWVEDVSRALDALAEREGTLPKSVSVVGIGPAGLIALCAGVLDERITEVVTVGTMVSFIAAAPYEDQRLGTIVPGILKEVGDVDDLMALIAPRPMTVLGGVTATGRKLALPELNNAFMTASGAYSRTNAANALWISDSSANWSPGRRAEIP